MEMELLEEKQAGEHHIILQVPVGLEASAKFVCRVNRFQQGSTLQSNHNTRVVIPPLKSSYSRVSRHTINFLARCRKDIPSNPPATATVTTARSATSSSSAIVDSSSRPRYLQVPIYQVSSASPNQHQCPSIYIRTYNILFPPPCTRALDHGFPCCVFYFMSRFTSSLFPAVLVLLILFSAPLVYTLYQIVCITSLCALVAVCFIFSVVIW